MYQPTLSMRPAYVDDFGSKSVYFDSSSSQGLYDKINSMHTQLTDTFHTYAVWRQLIVSTSYDRSCVISGDILDTSVPYKSYVHQVEGDTKSFIQMSGDTVNYNTFNPGGFTSTIGSYSLSDSYGYKTANQYGITGYVNGQTSSRGPEAKAYRHTMVRMGLGSYNYNRPIGYLKEAFIFDRVLNFNDKANLDAWLKSKYGI